MLTSREEFELDIDLQGRTIAAPSSDTDECLNLEDETTIIFVYYDSSAREQRLPSHDSSEEEPDAPCQVCKLTDSNIA